MNFQDDIPSFSIDVFKDHYVLVFDLTPGQDDTESQKPFISQKKLENI